MIVTLAKLLVAGACLGVVCWFGRHFFFPAGMPHLLKAKLIGVGTTVIVGTLVYFGVAYLLRVAELRDLIDVVKRRVAR